MADKNNKKPTKAANDDETPITKRDLKRYGTIAALLLAVYGYANYKAALLSARQALKEEAAITASSNIIALAAQATTNAALIAESAKKWQSGEYLQHLAGLAEGVEKLYQAADKSSQSGISNFVVPSYHFFRGERDKGKK